MKKNNIVFLFILVILSIIAIGFYSFRSNRSGLPSINQIKKETQHRNFSFNREDKNAISNGNMRMAIEMFDWIAANSKGIDTSIYPDSITKLSMITKQPYSAIGKTFRIRGEIYKIEQMPLGSIVDSVAWTDILLSVPDKNNPLGRTTVEFIYNGDVSNIDNKDIIDLFGYFCGSFESQNAMGGTISGLIFVGNNTKIFRKYRRSYY